MPDPTAEAEAAAARALSAADAAVAEGGAAAEAAALSGEVAAKAAYQLTKEVLQSQQGEDRKSVV